MAHCQEASASVQLQQAARHQSEDNATGTGNATEQFSGQLLVLMTYLEQAQTPIWTRFCSLYMSSNKQFMAHQQRWNESS